MGQEETSERKGASGKKRVGGKRVRQELAGFVRRYVRTILLPEKVPPVRLAFSPSEGFLLAHSWADLSLHLFTVNGRRLVSAEGTERLNAVQILPEGKLLLTGGGKGMVTLRWLHSLQVPRDRVPCMANLKMLWLGGVRFTISISHHSWQLTSFSFQRENRRKRALQHSYRDLVDFVPF